MNCVYKPCPAALYSVVQSCCSILSHDTLHHCLSSNSSLENSKREQGHLSRYYSNRKNTSRIVFRERAYSATSNSRVHYLKSGYVIQLIAFRWDKACVRSSPDPSLSCGSGSSWLARLPRTQPGPFETERAWYPLFAHALNFPDIPGIPDNTLIPPCAVTFTCTLPYIYSYTADNGCMHAVRPGFCRVVCLTAT